MGDIRVLTADRGNNGVVSATIGLGSVVLCTAGWAGASPALGMVCAAAQVGVLGVSAWRRDTHLCGLTLFCAIFLLAGVLSPSSFWPLHFLVPLVMSSSSRSGARSPQVSMNCPRAFFANV